MSDRRKTIHGRRRHPSWNEETPFKFGMDLADMEAVKRFRKKIRKERESQHDGADGVVKLWKNAVTEDN